MDIIPTNNTIRNCGDTSSLAVKTATGAALGNTTEFASAAETLETRNWRNDTVKMRYRLQDAARGLLPDQRVAKCMKISLGGAVEVWQDTKTKHAHLKGVTRCGSVWTCPVCSAKVSLQRRAELQDGISKARANGWYPVFVTYTARHSREDELADMLKKTRKSQRSLKSGRWWQNNVKKFGLNGSMTAVEVTYGHDNGWHVHYHAIMLFDAMPDLKELEDKLFERWYAVLQRNGLDCDREHGVDVKPGNHAANYVSKWGIQNELAGGYKNAKDGHFTPFELLYLYDIGHGWAGAKYQEYAAAFKGVSQLRWSKDLAELLGCKTFATDQELAENDELSVKSVIVARFRCYQYQDLILRGGPGVIGELLMVAESGRGALDVWLMQKFKIELEDFKHEQYLH